MHVKVFKYISRVLPTILFKYIFISKYLNISNIESHLAKGSSSVGAATGGTRGAPGHQDGPLQPWGPFQLL